MYQTTSLHRAYSPDINQCAEVQWFKYVHFSFTKISIIIQSSAFKFNSHSEQLGTGFKLNKTHGVRVNWGTISRTLRDGILLVILQLTN